MKRTYQPKKLHRKKEHKINCPHSEHYEKNKVRAFDFLDEHCKPGQHFSKPPQVSSS